MQGLLILPALALILDLIRRSRFHLRGDQRRSPQGTTYWVRAPKKGLRERVIVGVRAPSCFDFVLRAEASLDRIAKRKDVSRELQTDDGYFDLKVYVESEDPVLEALLAEDQVLRDNLREMISGTGGALKVKQIGCRGGTLYAVIDKKTSVAPSVLTDKVADRLDAIAAELWTSPRAGHPSRDIRATRARMVQWTVAATAALGVAGAYAAPFVSLWIIDVDDLFVSSVRLGFLAAIPIMLLVWRLLGKGPRTHMILVETLGLALYAGVALGFSVAYYGNVWLDRSPAQVLVYEADQYSGGWNSYKGTVRYRYVVPDWRPGREGLSREVGFSGHGSRSRRDYGVPRGSLTLVIRPGRFGYDWVESFQGG